MCRGSSIQYGSKKKKNTKNRITNLGEEISEIQATLNDSRQGPQIQDRLQELKIDLEREVEEETKGYILRNKARWHEEGEKSNKFFLNLEKRNYNQEQ